MQSPKYSARSIGPLYYWEAESKAGSHAVSDAGVQNSQLRGFEVAGSTFLELKDLARIPSSKFVWKMHIILYDIRIPKKNVIRILNKIQLFPQLFSLSLFPSYCVSMDVFVVVLNDCLLIKIKYIFFQMLLLCICKIICRYWTKVTILMTQYQELNQKKRTVCYPRQMIFHLPVF